MGDKYHPTQELDLPLTDGTYRSTCIKCLSALGKSHNVLPVSFLCSDVRQTSSRPVNGGGFAVSFHTDNGPGCLLESIGYMEREAGQHWKGRLSENITRLHVGTGQARYSEGASATRSDQL